MASDSSRILAITGGASGIGAATCRLLAERGAAVLCISDISPKNFDDLKRFIKKINQSTEVHCTTVDVASSAEGAGLRSTPTIAEETDEEWNKILNTNLNGAFYCTREEVRAMKDLPAGDRSVVNVGSIAGCSHMPDVYVYGTSKGACAYFTHCAAADVIPRGIRINNVSPGVINTPMLPQLVPGAKSFAEIEESYKKDGLA
ncbi:hypothetical protein BBP40_011462 [Aspergillus hancockii]|nr:hypothetical protein BBP40_011462 [Aspergillus hancockii]